MTLIPLKYILPGAKYYNMYIITIINSLSYLYISRLEKFKNISKTFK